MLKAVLGAVAAMAFVLMAAQMPGMAAEQGRQALDQAHVEQWLNAYKTAWETKDADKAAALFTADARYRDNPFEPAHEGRAGIHAYWSAVTTDQSNIAFSSTITAVSGAVAVAPWHAEFTQTSTGAHIALDGVFILEFDENGLCRDLKEWWHIVVTPASAP